MLTTTPAKIGQVLRLTLAIIKPDVTQMPFALQGIRNMILENGFFVIRSKQYRMSQAQAKKFYAEHEEKFFFNRLVTFMSSGPIHVHILAHEDAINVWRKLMGPTKVFCTHYEAPETIRGLYGLSDTRNCTHGSDSPDSAAKEIAFFFPEFNIEKWYKEEEGLIRNCTVAFDEEQFVHRKVKECNS